MFKYIKFTKVQAQHTVLEFKGNNESVKVNHFDKDIASIEADIEADIDALISNQPTEINATVITTEEFKAIFITTTQYLRIKERVEEKYNEDVSYISNKYPLHERETWGTQLMQAKAFTASGNEVDAPFLKIMADAESDTIQSFVDAVIANANEYETFMAQQLVIKRAFEKSLFSEMGL